MTGYVFQTDLDQRIEKVKSRVYRDLAADGLIPTLAFLAAHGVDLDIEPTSAPGQVKLVPRFRKGTDDDVVDEVNAAIRDFALFVRAPNVYKQHYHGLVNARRTLAL